MEVFEEVPLVIKVKNGVMCAGKHRVCNIKGFASRRVPYVLFTDDGDMYRLNITPEVACKLAKGIPVGIKREELTNKDKALIAVATALLHAYKEG